MEVGFSAIVAHFSSARPVVPDGIYRFGDFELNRPRFELLRQGQPVKIERIPMELLTLLVESEGRVVSRAEIIERLWGKDVFVDTEHGVNTAIRKVRTALHDDADHPRFLQTVPGKGYRFIPAVEVVGRESSPAPTVVSSSRTSTPRWWRIGTIAVGLIAVVVTLVLGITNRRSNPPAIRSIAVLPLSNLTGDPAQNYFADGITDELITMLARNTSLRVISRTSVMQFKSVNKPLREIAQELGADAILEGSISRTGTRVHVNVQLISAPGDSHIWAESYDRSTDEVYALPAELSYTIARKLRTDSTPVKQIRYVKPEAHDAYLRGRFYWFSNDTRSSLDYMKKAVELQPDYAAAWSGLGDCYTVLAVGGQAPPREVMHKAQAAVNKALELDDSLAEGHNALGALHLFYDWDWKKADEETQRAVQLDPTFAEVHHLRSYLMIVLNRPEEALREQKLASRMDPFARPWALGYVLMRLRHYDAAIDELQKRKKDFPQDPVILNVLGAAYTFKGMKEESAKEWEEAVLQGGRDSEFATQIRQAFKKGGDKAVAEWRIQQRQSDPELRKHYLSPLAMARWQAQARHREAALKALEEAYEARVPFMIFVQTEPAFDFLHGDPRYRAIVQKIGLPPAD
jgi:TolB-like protein/DNA-binding winged helix-turn-helix (wHTH) protein/Flp pilus assembly protein TadD